MKNIIWIVVIVILAIGLAVAGSTNLVQGGQSPVGKPAPMVTVVNPVNELNAKAPVIILGAGFEPEQEIHLITTIGGIKSDMDYTLKPAPVPNEVGAWATTFTGGRYISRGLMKEWVYTIEVMDGDYNLVAYAVMAFYDTEKPTEEWPSWATAVAGE